MAIATRELRVVVTIDNDEDGVDRTEEGLERIGRRAKKTSEEGASAFDKFGRAVAGVASPAEDLETLLGRLETAGVAPVTLARNAEKAQAALNLLKQELIENEGAAERLGPEFQEALGKAQVAIDGAKTKAKELGAEWERIGQTPTKLDDLIAQLRKGGVESEGLARGIARARQSLDAAKDSWDSPRQLQQAAQKASIQVDDLRKEIEQARAAGQHIGDGTVQQLKAMEQELEAVKVRLGETRDKIGDFRDSADLAGNKLEKFTQTGFTLEGSLQRMSVSTDKGTESFGKIGLASLGVVAGLNQAIELGHKLGAGLEWLVAKSNAHAEQLLREKNAQLEATAARAAAAKGLIAMGDSIAETVENYRHLQAVLRDDVQALSDLGLKPIQNLKQLGAASAEVQAKLEQMFRRSSAEGLAFAVANEEAVQQLIDAYHRAGEEAPAALEMIVVGIERVKAAQKGAFDEAWRAQSKAAADELVRLEAGLAAVAGNAEKETEFIQRNAAALSQYGVLIEKTAGQYGFLSKAEEEEVAAAKKVVAAREEASAQAQTAIVRGEALIESINKRIAAMRAELKEIDASTAGGKHLVESKKAEIEAAKAVVVQTEENIAWTRKKVEEQGLDKMSVEAAREGLSRYEEKLREQKHTISDVSAEMLKKIEIAKVANESQERSNKLLELMRAVAVPVVATLGELRVAAGGFANELETRLGKSLFEDTELLKANREAIEAWYQKLVNAGEAVPPALERIRNRMLELVPAARAAAQGTSELGEAFDRLKAASDRFEAAEKARRQGFVDAEAGQRKLAAANDVTTTSVTQLTEKTLQLAAAQGKLKRDSVDPLTNALLHQHDGTQLAMAGLDGALTAAKIFDTNIAHAAQSVKTLTAEQQAWVQDLLKLSDALGPTVSNITGLQIRLFMEGKIGWEQLRQDMTHVLMTTQSLQSLGGPSIQAFLNVFAEFPEAGDKVDALGRKVRDVFSFLSKESPFERIKAQVRDAGDEVDRYGEKVTRAAGLTVEAGKTMETAWANVRGSASSAADEADTLADAINTYGRR